MLTAIIVIMGFFAVLYVETRAAMNREIKAQQEEEHNIRHHCTDEVHHEHKD